MDKKYIHRLITAFFRKDISREDQDRFQAWFIRERNTTEKEEVLEDIWNSLPQSVSIASFGELQKVNKRIHSRGKSLYSRLAMIAAAFLLPLLGAVSVYWYMRSEPDPQPVHLVESFVPNGQRKQITLPDGSEVWLNAGSLLVYPETFARDSRTLFLSGEGNFTVAKDPDRPFIVKTNYIDVEALGTVFNLQSYPDSDKTTTTLETGKVRVDDKSGLHASVILEPNEELVYNHIRNTFDKGRADAVRVSSWIDGFLVFQQESVSHIFKSLERRYNIRINYNDSKFTDATFTVRFHAEETLEEALEVLRRIGVDFTYKIAGNDVYIQ